MTDNDESPPERRPWRTEEEWLRLRERITSADLGPGDVEPSGAPEVSRTRTTFARWARRGAYAAGLVLVTVTATLGVISRFRSTDAERTRVVSTGVGERVAIRLPDSSTVVVGPKSTLEYSLSASRHEMRLTGIADFHVRHDAARVFVVHTTYADAIDLGTEFDVRSYPGEPLEIAVASGSIALRPTRGVDSTITLRGGMVAQVSSDGRLSVLANVNAAGRSAWIDGRLVFDDEPLARVATELERWFGVRIQVTDSALARRHVSVMQNDPSLNGALNALAVSLGLRWERASDGRTIVIRER